jgi:hypothetical protein
MLQSVQMNFKKSKEILPTFLKPLLKTGPEHRIGDRILLGSIELATEDGRILCIHDGETLCENGRFKLRLVVMNKMERKNLFEIRINVDYLRKAIQLLEITRWVIDQQVGKLLINLNIN